MANQGQSPGEGQSPLGHRACDSTFSPPTSFFQNCRCLSSVMMTSLVESPHLSLCLPAMSGKKFLPLSGAPTDNPQHLPLEDPAYLERSFVCRFRCLLDNSSGFLVMALSLEGQELLKPEHGSAQTSFLAIPGRPSGLQPAAVSEGQTLED